MPEAARDLLTGRDKLPPGRHGLPRDLVAENQRERLLNGVVEAVAEHGYNEATIGRIAAAAKVSRRTFYEYFPGKEECFLAAFAMIEEHVRESVMKAADADEPWPEQVRERLSILLSVLSHDEAVARFYLVEPLVAGGEPAARHREAMQLLAEAVRPKQALADMDVEVRDQALIGGVAAMIARRLKAGEADRLPELLPELTELVLAPYLGREAARRFAAGESS